MATIDDRQSFTKRTHCLYNIRHTIITIIIIIIIIIAPGALKTILVQWTALRVCNLAACMSFGVVVCRTLKNNSNDNNLQPRSIKQKLYVYNATNKCIAV